MRTEYARYDYRRADHPARALMGNVLLADRRGLDGRPPFTVTVAEDEATVSTYRRLRHDAFVAASGLFSGTDRDDADDDPRTVVLVARDCDGSVLGGVRLGPVSTASWSGPDIGWWTGSRLVVTPHARAHAGVGTALVRAACAHAEAAGVLRFEALARVSARGLFTRIGWRVLGETTLAGAPHLRLSWPIGRFEALARATKAPLGALLSPLLDHGPNPDRGLLDHGPNADRGLLDHGPNPDRGLNPGSSSALGGRGYVGDDAAPVPGTDLVAACDAILPSLVERDPEWAGWCAVLVNAGDLAAMGAEPVGLTDAIGARDASFAARVLSGLRRGSDAYRLPVLGGHTQLGVPAALSVTALGRTSTPVPAGGGRPGHDVSLTADLGGSWRAGHTGRQWDSTSGRSRAELAAMTGMVGRTAPAAAKDVSMAGVVGTLGMLAEASGCAAELDVAAVPRPGAASMGDWLTCFPGFAMLTADRPGRAPAAAGPAVTATCGRLLPGEGVTVRWPDGAVTAGVSGAVTGLGAA